MSQIRVLRSRASIAFVGTALLLAVSATHAKNTYLSAWEGTYPSSTTSDTSGRNGCQVCHGSANSQWNAYGDAIQTLVRSGTAIGAAITQVEGQDSDGQGDSNLNEINANAQPGWTAGANNPIFDDNGDQTGTIDATTIGVQSPLDPPAAPPIAAVVDISPNTLHPRHDGSGDTATSALLNDVIPVVVFGASTLVGDPENLDTDLIDLATLAFGPGMGGTSPSHPQEFNLDVDSDGLDDARFRFLMGDAAFDKVTCSDDTGTLVGELTTGETFAGADTFTSNCNASCH